MLSKYNSVEKRRFVRIPFEGLVSFRKLSFFEHKILDTKLATGVSKNLSTTGLFFISKEPPALSSIILIDLSVKESPLDNSIKKNVLMLDGKLLGKVVRLEEADDERYHVGVTFIGEPQSGTINAKHIVTHIRLWRSGIYLFQILFTLAIVYLILSLNMVYLEQKETYHPAKIMYTNPESLGIFYEDADLRTEDGQTINAWFIPAKNAKVTVLYCHGNSGNMSDYLSTIKFFNAMDVNFMIFDYRGYGNSSGKPSEQGFYKDAMAAYDFLLDRNDIDKDRIVVFGESLGGAVAANLCLIRKAQGLVLESPITSLVIQAKKLYPYLPVDHLLFEKFDTSSKIKNILIPKLIVQGLDDETISFNDVLNLYYTAPEPKRFLPFQGLHNDQIYKVSDIYKNELIKFFQDNNIL